MNVKNIHIIYSVAAAVALIQLTGCTPKPKGQMIEDESVRHERLAIERGNALFARGDYAEALDEYDAALEANPQSKSARFNRAMAMTHLISDEERDQLLQPDSLRVKNTMRERAIEAYGNFTGNQSDTLYYTDANYNLGNLYYADGKYFYEKDSIQQALMGGMGMAMGEGSQQDYRKHSISTLESSIEAYKHTLNLQPERMEARENLRLAQILLEKLKDDNGGGGDNNQDQQDQQQDQQQQQQDQQQQDQQQQQQQQQQQNEDIERQLRAVQMKEDQVRRDKEKDTEAVYGRPQRKPW